MDKLNLGAGNDLVVDAINHDLIKHRPEIDVAHDLDVYPWPWEDCSFDVISAKAVFEHLRDTLLVSVGECWRILRPGGLLYMKLPMWDHERSYDDVTHYWRFTLRSCDVFDPDTEFGKKYAFYTERKWRIINPAVLNSGGTSLHITMARRESAMRK